MPTTLPFEVIETIIDILARDDHGFSSTKTCALVCHDLLHLCRKHIFAFITLIANDKGPTMSTAWNQTKATMPKLQQLLNTTPEIAGHIRVLNYRIASDDLKNVSLTHTFAKIKRLESLTISCFGIPNLQCNGTPLWPMLLHLLHLPTLVHLKLSFVNNFVVTDLMPCINLDHFEFEHLTVLDTLAPNLPETSIRLHKISAGHRSTAATMKMSKLQLTDRTPFLDFSNLTDLSVDIIDFADTEAFRVLLSRCSRLINVRIRDLHLTNFTDIGLSKLLHPSIRTLKHLYVDTTIDEEMGSNSALSTLSCELEAMKNNNIIETITIGVDVESDINREPGDQWDCLEEVLDQSGWPKLQLVSLTITVWSYEDEEFQRILKKLPRTPFPKLSSSKTFLFEFAVVRFDDTKW